MLDNEHGFWLNSRKMTATVIRLFLAVRVRDRVKPELRQWPAKARFHARNLRHSFQEVSLKRKPRAEGGACRGRHVESTSCNDAYQLSRNT